MNEPERIIIRGASFHKRALFRGMIVGAAGVSLIWFLFNVIIEPLLFGW